MLGFRDHEAATALEAVAAGRPLVVVGEAGVGKTTLVSTVAEITARRVFEGGALATLGWMEHLALTRALGREPVGADRQAVATDVQVAVGDGLLVLEDVQWAADPTLEVMTALAHRVALLATVRTGSDAAVRVLRVLGSAGFEVLDLEPLDEEHATALARGIRPELTADELDALVRRAGGNPLLLSELAATGEASSSLRRSVRARLRHLPEEDRDEFARLALAGRPLPGELMRADAAERLMARGLLTTSDGLLHIRHALLGEVAVDDLTGERRADLHRRLAELLPDPAEAARHHEAAGDRDRARELALVAAEAARRPGERASHLRLAALNASGEDADTLRLAAAESLEAAHDWDGLMAVLDQVAGSDPDTVARTSLLRAKGAWSSGRTHELESALTAGLEATTGTGNDLEVLLRIEACRLPIFVRGELEQGVVSARAALELATERGVGVERAEYFLGTALSVLDEPGSTEHLSAAIERSRAVGDVGTELTAANNLISFHESSGSPAAARDLAAAMAVRARELGLGYWETSFLSQQLQLDFHTGAYEGLVARIQGIRRLPLDPRSRDALDEVLCMALVDTGYAVEAARLAQEVMANAIDDHSGATHFWWVLAEAALWGGEPRRAIEHAETFLAALPPSNPNVPFGFSTRAWARAELGEDPGPDLERPQRAMVHAVPEEIRALRAAHHGDHQGACEGFRSAAELWAPYHLRGELRCDWAAGEQARLAGWSDNAVTTLTLTEKRALDVGLVAVLGRVRRSLRACGVHRSAPRATGRRGLTARELEVLELVALGLSNDQIAVRLGTSRRTVVAQISTACTKLGASNRNQAAVLAADDGAGETA